MAFVKSLALLHKGDIYVYSERLKGTEIIIGIPVGESDYRKEEKRAVIAGPDQDAFILALTAVHKDPGAAEELEKGAVFGRYIAVGVDAGVEPV